MDVTFLRMNKPIYRRDDGITAYEKESAMKILLYLWLDNDKDTTDVVVCRENEWPTSDG